MCLGFLPVLGMALHNWVYGGVFVLFTTTSDDRAVDAAARPMSRRSPNWCGSISPAST